MGADRLFAHLKYLSAICQRRADGLVLMAETLLEGGAKSSTRAIPPAIHRALRARDGGCRFPGCTHRHFIHAHHIAPWAEGGETALENLVELCQYHHRLVHESGYGCRISDTGELCFTRPGGRPLHTVAPILVPDTGTTLEEESHKHGVHVNPHTCVPKWHGEVMDYGMGVEGLLQCAGRLNGPPLSAYP